MTRPITFRFALIALLLASVIPLSVGISVSAYLNSESTVRLMWKNLAHELVEDAQEKTLRYLEPGPSQLELHRLMAQDGSLKLDEPEALLKAMTRCIRAQETITWCSYANSDDSYFSAQRGKNGEIHLSLRKQVEGGTSITKRTLASDGTELSQSKSLGNFLPSQRPWWSLGQKATQPTWSSAFLFASEKAPGVVLTLRQEDDLGNFQGVWLAEYELSYLAIFLDKMRTRAKEIGGPFAQALVSVVDQKGVVLGHPDGLTQAGTAQSPELAYAQTHPDPVLKGAYVALRSEDRLSYSRFQFEAEIAGQPEEYLGVATQFDLTLAPDWTTVVALPAEALLGPIRESNRIAAIIATIVALLSTLTGVLLANRFVRPLARIAADLDAIGTLRIPEQFKAERSVIREIDHMIGARNRMGGGLRSFAKYVPADLVRELMSNGREATLGGTTKPLTVYFSDIAGFTSISEKLTPEELVNALADYLGEMSDIIADEQGTVDKFIGDAIMAFWGAPQALENHALHACRAALRSQARLILLRQQMKRERGIDLYARIGLNSGDVLVGNIGSDKRMNYTVMGDAVNVASRLEAQCKAYNVEILIGESTKEVAGSGIITRPLDKIAVKGKEQGIVVYELVALSEDATAEQVQLSSQASIGFELYLAGQFKEAEETFLEILKTNAHDRPTQILLERCQKNIITPPGYWDGIVRLTKK